jgi:site-specific DNA-methyltransferase (adenine-specific)
MYKTHKTPCRDVLEQLADNSIDFICQDPPFEVTNQHWDKGFIKMLPEMWPLWERKLKQNGVIVMKATYPFALDLLNSKPKKWKYYEHVWIKNTFTNFVNAKKMPLRALEYLFVFYRNLENMTYNPVLRKTNNPRKERINKNSNTKVYNIKEGNYLNVVGEYGQPVNYFFEGAENGRFVSSNGEQDRHPNRTPPKVWERMINFYTNPGDLIFDGYSGSGSVGQAAIRLDRNIITCETDDHFYEMTCKNLHNESTIKELGYVPNYEPNTLF